jgi:hypothetical protein
MNLKNITTFGLFFLAVINLTAQTYKLKSKDISVSGTSTLHKWTSQITQASGQGVFQFEEGQLSAINAMELNFPVKSIISTKGKIMDNKTWESLKSDKHPNVIYTFQSTESITKTSNGYLPPGNSSIGFSGIAERQE